MLPLGADMLAANVSGGLRGWEWFMGVSMIDGVHDIW